jgi:hypothetical protein
MSQVPPIPARRRRWFQFRLRTVLLGTVVLCLPLGWLSVKLERTRRQRRAVSAITNAGGFVWYLALQVLHLGKTQVTFQDANAFEEKLGRSVIIR